MISIKNNTIYFKSKEIGKHYCLNNKSFNKKVAAYAYKMLCKYNLKSWCINFVVDPDIGVVPRSSQAFTCWARKEITFITERFIENESIKEIVLHEIAHALSPHSTYHGRVWQKRARQIGVTYVDEYAGEK